ncbi:MAG: hypothetical protein KDB22_08380 [Planctomycetales bacterium]|nr:hypothetical protein [Planctomycetales bacterium]
MQIYTKRNLDDIPQLGSLSREQRRDIRVVSEVLPFRVNRYVLDELISWEDAPNDPIFKLVFPSREMLDAVEFSALSSLIDANADAQAISELVRKIQSKLNPHPGGQTTLNLPRVGNEELWGLQHKYRETLLFFPSQGQTCHTYCSFCFRWAQFIDDVQLRMMARENAKLLTYLESHREITDLLITGGDPMVMKTVALEKHLKPILEPRFDHVQNIRIGTKSLSFWPYRFVTDPDADDLLRLFSTLVNRGKHVAVMAHFDHPRELSPPVVEHAIRRIRDTGAVIRTQAPLLRGVNDSSDIWADMWRQQVLLGMSPYYMLVERDTGAHRYFELPLEIALDVYRGAMRQLSGLARTARGPVMSTGPGKVEIQGVAEVGGQKVFLLRFIQARNVDWTFQPFFAEYDPTAVWFEQLKPAFGEAKFPFEK